MKLLSVSRARSIWVMRFEDLNRHGKSIIPLISAVAQKYNFIEYTKLENLAHLQEQGMGLSFLKGTFINSAQIPVAVDLMVYNDAVFADTHSSTADSDAFLTDLLEWMTVQFDLSPYAESIRSRLYLSELWVQSSKSLNTLNPRLVGFVDKLNSVIPAYYNRRPTFETTGITIGCDRTSSNSMFGPFKFERAEISPFEENRYYSIASIPTDDHILLLDELEQILGG